MKPTKSTLMALVASAACLFNAPGALAQGGLTCGTAQVISAGAQTTSTVNGTYDPTAVGPSCDNGAPNAARWFRWTAPYSGFAQVTSCGGQIGGAYLDTEVSVVTGSCGGPWTLVACNDDDATNCGQVPGTEFASNTGQFPVIAGTTYYIQWNNGWSSNAFNWWLNYTPNGGGLNCNSATVITTLGTQFCATITGGTYDATHTAPGCGNSAPNSARWFAWTAPGSGLATVSSCGANTDTQVSVATGACGGPWTNVGCDDNACGQKSNSTFLATSGTTYYIQWNNGWSTNSFGWTLDLSQPGDACGPYSSSPALAIVDNTTVSNVIATGPQGGQIITDLKVHVDISHTWNADLTITLTSPSGTSVVLASGNCGDSDDMDVLWDDEAADPSGTTCPPIGAFEMPENALSAFYAEPFEGNWTLAINDNGPGDVGVLNSWCLIPTLATPGLPHATCDPGMGIEDFAQEFGPILAPGSQLGLDVFVSSVELVVASTCNQCADYFLISPSGMVVPLVSGRFGQGVNLGDPANCPNTVLTLQDGGLPLTNASLSNVSGVYQPEGSLTDFNDGGDANGFWYLVINLTVPSVQGSVEYLKINFSVPANGESCAGSLGPIAVAPDPGSCVNTLVTSGTTQDGPAASCSPGSGAFPDDDVWYSFVAPANGNKLVITTTGISNSDWVMEVWDDCPGVGGPIACSDDVNGLMPEIELCQFQYTAGNTYYIRAWTWGAGGAGSTMDLCIYEDLGCPPPPANDACANAQVLTVNDPADCPANAVSGDNAFAGDEGTAFSCSNGGPYNDVWYSFNSGAFTSVSYAVSNFTLTSIAVEVFEANCAGTSVFCAVGVAGLAANIPTTPGTEYLMRIASVAGGGGTFDLCLNALPPPPANNDCGNAIALAGCNTSIAGTTIAANGTDSPDDNCGTTSNTSPGVWYTVQGWGGGMTAGVCGSTTADSKIAIYTGGCGAFTCVAGNDDLCGFQSEVSWNGTLGTTYYIYVFAFNATAEYDFVLEVTCGDNQPVCADNGLTLEFQTDQYSNETTWEIIPQGVNTPACAGGGTFPPDATVTDFCCLPDGCYRLRVLDSFGDGMVTGGYIMRTTGTNERIIDNRNNFDGVFDGDISAISGGQGFCLPISSDKLVYTSCDKLDWINGQYVVASPNPAVSAEWIPGGANSVQDNNSGYEFWIFDPNGSYSFRRFRSHNVSDGFGPASATRACHMKLNNWALASHVPANTLMNVRVRARINGVNGEFGPACRLEIDPVLAACPRTKLMDIPGNQYYSCGATRTWGAGNYVHARPVSGANRYQFRFRIPAEGFQVIRTATTYFVQLNWTVLPLQDGKTYDVDVRVSKDAGLTWCTSADPWGDVCLLTISSGAPQPTGACCLPNATCITADQASCLVGGGSYQGDGTTCSGVNCAVPTCTDGIQNGNEEGVDCGGNCPLSCEPAALQLASFTELRAQIFPNPNRGDQFHLFMAELPQEVMTVNVDIYDLTGKRVMARTISAQDGALNAVVTLDGTLASGMYMVNILAGELRVTERLVIEQ